MKKTVLWLVVMLCCGISAADMVTLTINGTGSGSLGGVSFANKMFEWTLIYDTTSYAIPWGETQPIFLNPTSILTLEGEANPINLTQEHGVYVNKEDAGAFSIAPIRMTGSSPGSNILSVGGTLGWDGISSFTSTSISYAALNQFSNITTDQGSLTMDTGTVSSIVSVVPEPASALMIVAGGLVIAGYRRISKIYGCI